MNERKDISLVFPENAQERAPVSRVATQEDFSLQIERAKEQVFTPPFKKSERALVTRLPVAAGHGHSGTERPFAEEVKPRREIRGFWRGYHAATGALWFGAGLVLFIVDKGTLEVLCTLTLGAPEFLAALGMLHGYKKFNAARLGYTTGDLRLRGTWREVWGIARQIIDFLEKKFSRKPEGKDMRWWLANQ